jgi:hypothetical protein
MHTYQQALYSKNGKNFIENSKNYIQGAKNEFFFHDDVKGAKLRDTNIPGRQTGRPKMGVQS